MRADTKHKILAPPRPFRPLGPIVSPKPPRSHKASHLTPSLDMPSEPSQQVCSIGIEFTYL